MSDLRMVKGIASRERILASASELLATGGPAGITAGKLAKHAKVSKATIFHHFPKVEDVVLGVLEQMIAAFSEGFDEEPESSLTEYLRKLGRAVENASGAQRQVMAICLQFYLRSTFDPAFKGHQLQLTNLVITGITSRIEKILGRRLKGREKSIPLAIAVFLEGASVMSLIIDDRSQFHSAWKIFANAVVQEFNTKPEMR